MSVSLPTTEKSFAFVSLGCPKNLVDSERMLGKLAQDGYALQPDANGASVVVINTCGFIESARQESLSVIREMLDLKKQGKVGSVVVAGCLAERQKDMLLQEVPEVDQIVGVFGREEIVQAVDRAVEHQQEQRAWFKPAPVRALNDTARLRITPRHYAYLKISEGCDRLCTFCAIPKMRGKHATKPMEEVLAEARELAADGVRELLIVAQDSTYYGMDLYGEVRFAQLLRELNKVDGLEWIRVLYAYPEHITSELLKTLSSSEKVIPYIDMPLQHINDRVLKRMQRRVNRASTEKLIGQLRKEIPLLNFRTTFIVGFPGETEAEFEELRNFVKDMAFERAGVFTYSFEPDTPAVKLDGHMPEEVKQDRYNRLMETQQAVAFAWSERQTGREIEVIIDGADPEVPNHWLARSHADAPEIDGMVRVKGKNLRSGDIVQVKVTAADGYDLAARAVGTPR
ncbi:30S ribosomal protein S12 methylthiotransferase RimO [Telmatocola sphagniphila]|uniref:Ribosomal protein uS12 methylthiotransferase RimO n=1 Tax=Telmatocola sphagniphila TaxID=1123043 RepID=A0A8E6B2N6_9BACT|nr:30S ribosomal protein S12 methylthiotransferase RimO [Telmatocola sphagniphila]QVL29961.1 30S ribosomal protein S12 methylthiotransferase RimO [Telmatocola sphagniphila]